MFDLTAQGVLEGLKARQAELFSKGVVELGLARCLNLFDGYFELGIFTLQALGLIVLREGHGDGADLFRLGTNQLVFKAGDELT